MLPAVLEQLRCPVCRQKLVIGRGALVCGNRHAFDVARHGYVNLLVGAAASPGDDGAMIQARAALLAAGHFRPLAARLATLAAQHTPASGLLLEVGAGTAYYLSSVVQVLPDRVGLALDLSRYAARRAARAHARVAAVVADVRDAPLPLADGCVALALDIFAPRNPAELRRVLRPEGWFCLVTPDRHHLEALRAPLGLIDVDPDKDRRVHEALQPFFSAGPSTTLEWTMTLPQRDVHLLVAMGPSARHLDATTVATRAALLPDPTPVTASVRIAFYRPLHARAPSVAAPTPAQR